MSVAIKETALLEFLNRKEPSLLAKILELRTSIEGWLSYIPQTFPHYTRHTVKHSDAIVLQMSKLLFREGDAAQPVLNLSPMEAYIAAASAYLHDAGMVTSEKEKSEILVSDSWKEWTADGSGSERLGQIEAFRKGGDPADPTLRHFIADRQTRFLIAEFVRRSHHFRAKEIMSLHQERMGLFALNDPVLLRTIGDVCVAHGLDQRDLEDRERYPDRRDVCGEQVNVQFSAVLLRLGDLLDMSHDRACPLLLSAACPLPPESLAHWSQYQRISHFLTAPDVIEIRAECENQDEHRYLTDWCQWLVRETQNASVLMSRAARHSNWALPAASMDGPAPTIKIVPSPTASYIPHRWKFEIDSDAVFTRLIEDVYESPSVFIRELIQNALDATRCQMQLDLQAEGLPVPEFPTQVDAARRARYGIRIGLEIKEITNYLSGQAEKRQVLTIEDLGIGMDTEVIQRYFLQVGRSYYTTAEFQRSFRFVPTSRFGLGFLSVFGASDGVTVETHKPTSISHDGPLRLGLSGPRNYLLIEKGLRRIHGTRIEVVLRTPMRHGEVTDAVSGWCRRVEFPIIVNELGSETTINSETPDQFVCEVPDVTEQGATLAVRQFDVHRHGIEGELYVFACRDSRGESWADWAWANYTYPEKHPQAAPPRSPQSVRCINGIAIDGGYGGDGPTAERIDYRDGSERPVLARNARRRAIWQNGDQKADPRISSRWGEIVGDPLAGSSRAKGAGRWKYIQSLVEIFPLGPFWNSIPEAIPIRFREGLQPLSLNAVLDIPRLATEVGQMDPLPARLRPGKIRSATPALSDLEWDSETPMLTAQDVDQLSRIHRNAIFRPRSIESVWWHTSGRLIALWASGSDQWESWGGKNVLWAGLLDAGKVGLDIHKTIDGVYGTAVLNTRSALIQWLLRVKESCSKGWYGLEPGQYSTLREMFYDATAYSSNHLKSLSHYIEGWRDIPGLPLELYPPPGDLSVDHFRPGRPPAESTEKGSLAAPRKPPAI